MAPLDARTDELLRIAKDYKRHFISPSPTGGDGGTVVLSPLTVKRKMKPRIELPTLGRDVTHDL